MASMQDELLHRHLGRGRGEEVMERKEGKEKQSTRQGIRTELHLDECRDWDPAKR